MGGNPREAMRTKIIDSHGYIKVQDPPLKKLLLLLLFFVLVFWFVLTGKLQKYRTIWTINLTIFPQE